MSMEPVKQNANSTFITVLMACLREACFIKSAMKEALHLNPDEVWDESNLSHYFSKRFTIV